MIDQYPGQTEIADASAGGDFLSRERAALGEDADLFAANDTATTRNATIEDDEDDLLGGGGDFSAPRANVDADELGDFESSFPAISTQNDVR